MWPLNLTLPMKLFNLEHWDRGGFHGHSLQVLQFKRRILFEFTVEKSDYKVSPALMLQLSFEPLLELILGFGVLNLSFYILPRNYDYSGQ